jgi:hypothetical protein
LELPPRVKWGARGSQKVHHRKLIASVNGCGQVAVVMGGLCKFPGGSVKTSTLFYFQANRFKANHFLKSKSLFKANRFSATGVYMAN